MTCKIIITKVTMCFECPYCEADTKTHEYHCVYPGMTFPLTQVTSIPETLCPLPDKEPPHDQV